MKQAAANPDTATFSIHVPKALARLIEEKRVKRSLTSRSRYFVELARQDLDNAGLVRVTASPPIPPGRMNTLSATAAN
jgi:hypothetical protein